MGSLIRNKISYKTNLWALLEQLEIEVEHPCSLRYCESASFPKKLQFLSPAFWIYKEKMGLPDSIPTSDTAPSWDESRNQSLKVLIKHTFLYSNSRTELVKVQH